MIACRMTAKLYLFTEGFPCHVAADEELIETELRYLTEAFAEVHVIPVSALTADDDCAAPSQRMPRRAELRLDIARAIQTQRQRNIPGQTAVLLGDADARALLTNELPAALRHGPYAMHAARRLLAFLRDAVAVRDVAKALSANAKSSTVLYAHAMRAAALGVSLVPATANLLRVARAHGDDLVASRHKPAYLPFQRRSIAGLDRVFATTESGREHLRKRYPDLADRLSVDRLGTPAAASDAGASHDGVLRILSCAPATDAARVQLLARAVLRCRFPVHWTHLGGGPLAAQLRGRTYTLRRATQVDVIDGDNVPSVSAFAQSHAVDVFVDLGGGDRLNVAVMQALSASVPVIASECEGLQELITAGCGRVLRHRATALDVTRALTELAALSDEQRDFMRRQARQCWERRADARRLYPAFAERLFNLQEAAVL